MTNAPVYKSQVGNRPVNQKMLVNSQDAASFGGEIGRAMQSVKPATDNVVSAMALRDQIEGDTRVREGEEAFRSRSRDAIRGPGGYMSATGTQANGDTQKETTDRLERVRQEEAAKLNPRDREAFLARTSNYVIAQGDQIAEHTSQQQRQAAIDARTASVTSAQEDALDRFNVDADFEKSLSVAVNEQTELALLQGMPQEVIDRANEELVMDTLTQRAVLMADQNPEAAAQYIAEEARLSETQKAKLNETLKPLVQEHRVNKWLSQFTVKGATSGFVNSTAQRESGNGANRQNPNSSAGGMYGYLDSTWNTSLAAAKAAGALPPGYEDKTLAEMQGLKNDDVLATAVMQYDESRYSSAIEATGAPVNDVNKYMLHHFGMGAGPAVLRTLQTNPGASVSSVYAANGWDWNAVVAANPGVSQNMTVGELHAYAGAHIGQSGSVGGAVVQFDFARAYSFAQTIADPADRAAFLSTVEAREATEAARQRAARGQIVDEASTRYFETGQSNLTMGQQIALGIDGTSAFRDMVTKNETGKLTTDVTVYGLLTEMSSSSNPQTRKDFAAPGSIEPYINKLSKDDYRTMVERRALMRSELEGVALTDAQKLANPAMAVPVKPEHRTTIGRHLDRVGVKSGEKTAETRAKAEYDMEVRLRQQMIDFYRAEKREPSEAEVDDMLYAQTLQVTPGGMTSSPTLLFQSESMADGEKIDPQIEYENIPTAAREETTRRLSVVLGRTPTPEEVSAAYVNSTLIKGKLSPEPLDSVDIPMDVYTYGVGFLGMSDEELRGHWENYVNQVAAGIIDPVAEPFVPASGTP